MDLDECFRKGLIKKTEINKDLIKSLIEMSNIKEETVKTANINEINISAYVSLAYDSLREILEALALKNGFKIYNHEGHTAFLKEILKKSDDGDEFDEIRKVRNDVNYYGKDISVTEAQEYVNDIKELIKLLRRKF